MTKVLVTDSSERAALAVIRSLGKQGVNVIAAEDSSINSGFWSKYCNEKFIYPSPIKNKTRFVNALLDFVKNNDVDLLFPITDFTSIPIMERKNEFEKYVLVAIPPYSVGINAFDKLKTVEIAKQQGVPCPDFFIVHEFSELNEIVDKIKYPVVIKPRMKLFWIDNQAIKLKITSKNYAFSPQDLIQKFAKLINFNGASLPVDFFLIQEFAKGSGYGVEILLHDSKVKAVFSHKRLREYPITGGASTLRESVGNEKLEKIGINLLKAMNWEGVAMVEFKVDEKTGAINLIEVNGRFWGSLALGINAGVDFPFLLYQCMLGFSNFEKPNYFKGVKQRWLVPGDFLWFFSSLTLKDRFFQSFKDFFSSILVPDDVISMDDPKPMFANFLSAFSNFIGVVRKDQNLFGETKKLNLK